MAALATRAWGLFGPYHKDLVLRQPLLQGLGASLVLLTRNCCSGLPFLQGVGAVALVARAGSPLHHQQMVDSFWEAVEGLATCVPPVFLMVGGHWQHL